MITDLVIGAAIFLYLAVGVVWVAGRRSLQRRREVQRSAQLRTEAERVMARVAAGMPAHHLETPGPVALPAADAGYLDWLRDDLNLDLEGQP